jgi:hypothetical protein
MLTIINKINSTIFEEELLFKEFAEVSYDQPKS